MTQIHFEHDGQMMHITVNCRLSAVPILIELLEDTVYPIARENCPDELAMAERLTEISREIKSQLKSDRPE